MTENVAHRWAPITDLPKDWHALADPTLPVLAEEWARGRAAVGDSPEIRRFNAELLREVAIETGLIEGLYSIDRGTTETLIRMGLIKEELAQGIIDRSPDEIMPILEDQHSATEGLFDFVKQKRDLDVSYIKELHAHLTRHQPSTMALTPDGRRVEIPLLRGAWKEQPNNPRREDGGIHEYCPPEQVASEMDRLIDMHRAHDEAGVAPEVSAAWLHHRFTQIHPFQDGNGRVARSLASLVFLRAGWFLFGVVRSKRESYIDALEAADAGNEIPLTEFAVANQNTMFRRALTAVSKAEATELTEKEVWSNVIGRFQERRGLQAGDENWSILMRVFDRIEFDLKNFFPANFAKTTTLKSSVFYEGTYSDASLTRQASIKLSHNDKKIIFGGFLYDGEKVEFGSIVPFFHVRKEIVFLLDERYNLQRAIDWPSLERWTRDILKFMLLEWERRR